MGAGDLPTWMMQLLTMEVLDWEGPIVEIRFNGRVSTQEDVRQLAVEANAFVEACVLSRAERAYFVTCYDGLSAPSDILVELQDAFVDFNQRFSLGDVRYGGGDLAQTVAITTAIRSGHPSKVHSSRKEAVAFLRTLIDR